jgi:hypothetical protein
MKWLAIPFVLGGFILWGMLPNWLQFRAYLKIKARLDQFGEVEK